MHLDPYIHKYINILHTIHTYIDTYRYIHTYTHTHTHYTYIVHDVLYCIINVIFSVCSEFEVHNSGKKILSLIF